MNTDQTKKLASISDADLREQTKEQYRAVSHMAKSLAAVHAPNLMAKSSRGALEMQCVRSSEIMDMLGDTLNAMDAVDEREDGWLAPIFVKAQKVFGMNSVLGFI